MSDLTRILILDDDLELCRVLHEAMEEIGTFDVTVVHSIAQAEAKLEEDTSAFDIFILDARLPDGDGRDLCARWRKAGVQVPIIMLTGLGDEEDVVRGLDVGANDYVHKPFRLAVLMARLRTHLREHESSMHTEINLGRFVFRPADKLLYDPVLRKRIKLTDKETKVLRLLSRSPGKGVTNETLLAEVWGYNARMVTHTLETHIYRLRQKIEIVPSRPLLLRNERGTYSLHIEKPSDSVSAIPKPAHKPAPSPN